jgi:hypothetical protein
METPSMVEKGDEHDLNFGLCEDSLDDLIPVYRFAMRNIAV